MARTALLDRAGRCLACAWRCDLRAGSARCAVRALGPGGIEVDEAETHAALRPISELPLLHLRPGGRVLTLGSWGCSLTCRYCRNAAVALARRRPAGAGDPAATPAAIVGAARAVGAVGVSYQHNDPLPRAERVAAVLGAARRANLEAIVVTNGLATGAALALLGPRSTAWRIDLKAAAAATAARIAGAPAPWAEAYRTMGRLRRDHGLHVECSLTYSPLYHGPDEVARLGAAVAHALRERAVVHLQPLLAAHLAREIPPPDPDALAGAAERLRSAGVGHVYVHTTAGPGSAPTCCGRCGAPVVRRGGGDDQVLVDGAGRCRVCGAPSPLVIAAPHARGLS